jgi:A/G-specific adenine glycosylase
MSENGIDLFMAFQRELKKGITERTISLFQRIIYEFSDLHGRQFPWRETRDPYKILVSEFMLQQTQTDRVVEKYTAFLDRFPTVVSLAEAPLRDVLRIWKGLGYNRRAISLKKTVEILTAEYKTMIPSDPAVLTAFPGIGEYTASAVVTFAFNIPTIFIETNIRTVFMYFFFSHKKKVTDNEILPLLDQTLDRREPRRWYYALMDYGVMLKKRHKDLTKKSAQYHKQAPFKGSNREIRGMILEILLACQRLSESELLQKMGKDPARVKKNLADLRKEGFITVTNGMITLQEK